MVSVTQMCLVVVLHENMTKVSVIIDFGYEKKCVLFSILTSILSKLTFTRWFCADICYSLARTIQPNSS